MASTLKIDTLTTPDGTGNITFNRPINAAQGGVGKVLQMQYTVNTTFTSTSDTALPSDDSIPQISEGTNIGVDTAITASSSSNLLYFTGSWLGAHSGSGDIRMALFKTGTDNALWASKNESSNESGNHLDQLICHYITTAGSTSAQTFQLRVGPPTAGGTLYINGGGGDMGSSNTRKFGGVGACILTIMEIEV